MYRSLNLKTEVELKQVSDRIVRLHLGDYFFCFPFALAYLTSLLFRRLQCIPTTWQNTNTILRKHLQVLTKHKTTSCTE